MKFDLISGVRLHNLCEKYGKDESFFEEAYNKMSPKRSGAKALKDFPIGDTYRYPGQSGSTDGKGTFIAGEADFKEPIEIEDHKEEVPKPLSRQQKMIKEQIQNKRRKLLGI
jgi:hypothetical protein